MTDIRELGDLPVGARFLDGEDEYLVTDANPGNSRYASTVNLRTGMMRYTVRHVHIGKDSLGRLVFGR